MEGIEEGGGLARNLAGARAATASSMPVKGGFPGCVARAGVYWEVEGGGDMLEGIRGALFIGLEGMVSTGGLR